MSEDDEDDFINNEFRSMGQTVIAKRLTKVT